jgi:hypothetical protein
MSYPFLDQRREQIKTGKFDKGARSRLEVVQYFENKLNRYLINLPNSGGLLAVGWVCKDFWGPPTRRSYKIVIREYARVVHVHCQGTLIDRAHIIHKLMEEDEPAFPADKKKLTPKLAYAAGDFNAKRIPKLQGKVEARNEAFDANKATRELKTLSFRATQELVSHKASLGGRLEAVIFDADKRDPPFRYAYTKGSRVLTEPLLQRIKAVVNAKYPNAITGATGLTGV